MFAFVVRLKLAGVTPWHSTNGFGIPFEITGTTGAGVTVIVPFVEVEAEHVVTVFVTVTVYTPAAFTDKV